MSHNGKSLAAMSQHEFNEYCLFLQTVPFLTRQQKRDLHPDKLRTSLCSSHTEQDKERRLKLLKIYQGWTERGLLDTCTRELSFEMVKRIISKHFVDYSVRWTRAAQDELIAFDLLINHKTHNFNIPKSVTTLTHFMRMINNDILLAMLAADRVRTISSQTTAEMAFITVIPPTPEYYPSKEAVRQACIKIQTEGLDYPTLVNIVNQRAGYNICSDNHAPPLMLLHDEQPTSRHERQVVFC